MEGGGKMIDISDKKVVKRIAKAMGEIELKKETVKKIKEGKIKKGDVLTVARVAGINAVKNTPTLIPMCHQIPITSVDISFDIKDSSITSVCEVKAYYRTGVEMEALTGVTVTLLTVWDMVKYLEKDEKGQYPETRIKNIHVVEKIKGD
ncbi:MAG TPA: cyclic pyranopterin monophosphate synthase MoaC [Thermoplasmata archaeon]|nr:cyclic pyranopterin monophosphate synthase MoaC [Thermoplasmata archaeon]